MARTFLLIVSVFFSLQLFAQTGIGTSSPNASAKLDVFSDNKGFLPPRVTLTTATDNTTISNPAEGLLVYNKGSVGLQAGYYYWNGANWATIATATSAGNGVTSMDMVKLYDGVGNAATINSSGATFSVTTSGKYLFDFSTSAACNNCNVTLNFQVRDGANSNAVIASDMQTSHSNNVHAEYNGKVEANLIGGRSYNVLVTASSGGIYNNDYSRVYMKQVSGNLPVTGQSVEYGIARYTGADGASLSANAIVAFDATAAGNLAWSGNKFTLKANKTYELESYLAVYHASAGVAAVFQIYNYTNSSVLANGLYLSINGVGGYNVNANGPMRCIITPSTDIEVGVRISTAYGGWPSIVGSTNTIGVNGAANQSYLLVKQIGSSAIINPWTLAGTNTYNTTGDVGIGTSAPQSTLDIRGSQAQNYTATSSTSYTVLPTDNVIDLALSGTQTVTNFTASTTNLNRILTIVNNTSVTTKTISSYVNNLGTSVTTIPANSTLIIQSTGTTWKQINGIAASSNSIITTTNGNGSAGQLLSSNGNGTYTWVSGLLSLRVLSNVGGTMYTQSQLQTLYNNVTGFNAPDVVPIEVVNAANALNNTNYKVYLGHNKWWYTNARSVTTSSWIVFGGGTNKSDFGANIDASGLFTYK